MPATVTEQPRKSVVVGPYRLIAQIARGGMGIVYLAVTHGPGGFSKVLVVKELKASLAEEEEYVAMFLREARLAARLNHPNVVQTLDVRSEGDRHVIAMEFVDGQSLDRILRRLRKSHGKLPLEMHLHVIVQLLEGLHYIHELTDLDGKRMNLVHRDVSPQNVLVSYDGQVKILDFGIAKADGGDAKTSVGILKGKARYMAPEQAKFSPLDGRSDLFAVGVLLWEAIVGKPLWGAGTTENDILVALARGDVPRAQGVDPLAERLLNKALAPDPRDRFASAEEMQSAVQEYLASLAAPAVTARKLGKQVADLYAEERAQVNAMVEQILRDIADGRAGEEPVHLPFGRQHGTDPELSMDSFSVREESGSHRSRRPVTSSTGPGPEGRRTSSFLFVGIGLLSAAALVVGVLALRKGSPAPEPPAVVAKASTPVAAAPVASVRVVVKARPAEATIVVDDGPPQTGTWVGTVTPDKAEHTIRVEHPKHKPQTMPFAADADHTFDVALEPLPTPPVAAVAAPVFRSAPPRPPPAVVVTTSAPPASASTPPPAPPTATGKKRQPIEKNDPYAQ